MYDGDQAYGDRVGGVWQRVFLPGVGRIEPFDPMSPSSGDNTEYYHGDHLGSMRAMTDPGGNGIDHNEPAVSGVGTVYTAFGEPVVNTFADGASNRYAYIGAHGYQMHEGMTEVPMPYLHVGARYYDPATGRFLQRDPIGIDGGLNVYAYVANAPTIRIDPSGQGIWTIIAGTVGTIVGGALIAGGATTGNGLLIWAGVALSTVCLTVVIADVAGFWDDVADFIKPLENAADEREYAIDDLVGG